MRGVGVRIVGGCLAGRSQAQRYFQKRRGAGGFGLRDDLVAGLSGLGCDGYVMLNDSDGVALIDEALEDVDVVVVFDLKFTPSRELPGA